MTEKFKSIYQDVAKIDSGEVASYIPELAKVDPKLFGLSFCSIDGQRFQIGIFILYKSKNNLIKVTTVNHFAFSQLTTL